MSSIRKVPEKAPLSVSESRTALTHASSSKWLFRCLVCFNLYHKPRRPRLALPPITQMRKLRHREVTALARGHTVRKWWRGGGTQDLFQVAMSGSLTPAPDNNDNTRSTMTIIIYSPLRSEPSSEGPGRFDCPPGIPKRTLPMLPVAPATLHRMSRVRVLGRI